MPDNALLEKTVKEGGSAASGSERPQIPDHELLRRRNNENVSETEFLNLTRKLASSNDADFYMKLAHLFSLRNDKHETMKTVPENPKFLII